MNMKHGKKFLLLGLLAVSGTGFAQVEMTEEAFQPYSVTNEGLVVVQPVESNVPYYLWSPEEGEMRLIGGISAGDGVGGVARFTDDGRKVAAVMMDSILLPLQWDTLALSGLEALDSVVLTDILFYQQSSCGIVVGKRPLSDTMVIMTTVNEGRSWNDLLRDGSFMNLEGKDLGGLNVLALADQYNVMAGGDKATFHYGWLTGGTWNPVANLPGTAVESYSAIDFIVTDDYARNPGLVGGVRIDGQPFLWRTKNSGDDFDTVIDGLGGFLPTFAMQEAFFSCLPGMV